MVIRHWNQSSLRLNNARVPLARFDCNGVIGETTGFYPHVSEYIIFIFTTTK
nr:MAG TPA: hypothetical protein [Caudoviricetes sp.]